MKLSDLFRRDSSENGIYSYIENNCFTELNSKIDSYFKKNVEAKNKANELRGKLNTVIKNNDALNKNMDSIPSELKGEMKSAIDNYISNYSSTVSTNASKIMEEVDKQKAECRTQKDELTLYFHRLEDKYDDLYAWHCVPVAKIWFIPYLNVFNDKINEIHSILENFESTYENLIEIRSLSTNYIK